MSTHSYNTLAERSKNWAHDAASVFKILADPTRCKILKLLIKNKDGLCVGEIADSVKISHSAASHQLNRLESAEVLKSIRDGQTICYEIADSRMSKNIIKMLEAFFI